MSQEYIFNQAGCIPGLPGIFANCRVKVDDDGTLTVTPLSLAGFTYSGGGGPLIVQEVWESPAPEVQSPTNAASEPEPEPEPAPVEAPAPEAQPEPTSEPTSPPAFENGG